MAAACRGRSAGIFFLAVTVAAQRLEGDLSFVALSQRVLLQPTTLFAVRAALASALRIPAANARFAQVCRAEGLGAQRSVLRTELIVPPNDNAARVLARAGGATFAPDLERALASELAQSESESTSTVFGQAGLYGAEWHNFPRLAPSTSAPGTEPSSGAQRAVLACTQAPLRLFAATRAPTAEVAAA